MSNTIFLQDNISKYGYNHNIHNISTYITIFQVSRCMALVTIFWGNCTICAHYCPTTTQKVGKNLGNFASNLRSAHPVSPNHCCSGSSKRNIVCRFREIQFSNTKKYSCQIQRNTETDTCDTQLTTIARPQLKSLDRIWGTLSPTYDELILLLQLNPTALWAIPCQ